LVAEKCVGLIKDERENKDISSYLAGNSPVKRADANSKSY